MRRHDRFRPLFLLFALLALTGCSALQPDIDPPKLSIDNVRSLPGQSGAPRFAIDLRIQNPNEQSLDIAGIAFDIALQDVDLISGVTNEVPLIEGYAEEVVTLESGLNTIQLIRFLASIGMGKEDMNQLEYRVSVKVDFSGFMPTQRIEETGIIGQPRQP